MKGRNPKTENRRKPEIRKPKAGDEGLQSLVSGYWPTWLSSAVAIRTRRSRRQSSFGFRYSDFLRLSDFGFRVLPLALSLLAAQTLCAATTNPPSLNAIPPLRPPRGEIAPTFGEEHGLWVILGGVLLLGVISAGVWWLRRPRSAVLVPP